MQIPRPIYRLTFNPSPCARASHWLPLSSIATNYLNPPLLVEFLIFLRRTHKTNMFPSAIVLLRPFTGARIYDELIALIDFRKYYPYCLRETSFVENLGLTAMTGSVRAVRMK